MFPGHLAVLVHCGAGVSRSATLCVAYLMRRFGWGATRAQKHVLEKRKKISINPGFWAMLVQLQKALGIDEPIEALKEEEAEVQISKEAAGIPVPVIFTPYEANAPGNKRQRTDPLYDLPSKRSKTNETSIKNLSVVERQLIMEVWRHDVCLGTLEIGPLRRHQRCVFGRAPSVDIQLEHASISRQHAKLEISEFGRLELTDLGSGIDIASRTDFMLSDPGHGTNVNDVWIRANTPKQLFVGSKIKFAASTRVYKVIKIV